MQPIAEQLVAELAAVAPWAMVGAFAASARAWARAEARAQLLHEYLDEHGMLDEAGVPRPALGLSEQVEKRAATLRAQLSLTPQTWAQLRRTMTDVSGGDAADIRAGLVAAGRQMLEAKEAAELVAGEESQ